jgi:proteasome lid subunit RPN8/RPN11
MGRTDSIICDFNELIFDGGRIMPPTLVIPLACYHQMLKHIQACIPEEACGILGGKGMNVELVIPVTNRDHSPVRFYMEPLELLHALETLEHEQLEMNGIFHSHPTGPQIPSETDIKEFLYTGIPTLIWSYSDKGWVLRAFQICKGYYEEIGLYLE